jgi:hypothetical protein
LAIAAIVLIGGTVLGVAINGVPSRATSPDVRLSAEHGVTSSTASSTTSATIAPPTSGTVVLREPSAVRVRAYNASTTTGAAGRVRERLMAEGYEALLSGTSTIRLPTSAVLYQPGFKDEATALAIVLELNPDTAVLPLVDASPFPDSADVDVLVRVADDLVT